MIKPIKFFLLVISFFSMHGCFAAEDLITTAHIKNGDAIPYILNYHTLSPKYIFILFPGGNGDVDPHMEEGTLVYKFKGNFLLQARKFIVDDEFITVTTNASPSEERIQAILDDLKGRFPAAQIYLVGTSKGTYDTMALAGYLSDKIAGEIHTSSLQSIASFNPKKYQNRHLLVHHKKDGCRVTGFYNAEYSHNKYGTELIAMDGGITEGDPCEPGGYHGFNGIRKETIDAIKNWVRQGS